MNAAYDHLFDVGLDEDRMVNDEDQARDFHHTIAQLRFAPVYYQPDKQTALAFLFNRVKKLEEDYWGKLKQLLKYIQ